MAVVIDIAIGLAFVFALVALICTALQEWLSASLNLRGKTLWEGVQSMLLADAEPAKPGAGGAGGAVGIDAGCQLSALIAKHPLIKGRVPDRFNMLDLGRWLLGSRQPTADIGSSKPSYLNASSFATALADAVGEQWKGGSRRFEDFGLAVAVMPEGPLKKMLLKMVEEAQGDAAHLRATVEAWYDETMMRVSGWYKRRVQVLLMAIGLIVAAGMNIDAIYIANSLATHPALRESLAKEAVKAADEYQVAREAAPTAVVPPAAAAPAASASDAEVDAAFARHKAALAREQAESARKRLQDLNLPIGWDGAGRPTSGIQDWLLMALGWLLTGLAASFGAPFWFDLISRLSPVRAAGKPPASTENAEVAAGTKAGATAASPSPSATAVGQTTTNVPFRSALNSYEAQGISETDLLRVKRMLGVGGQSATTPLIDQSFRDAILARQAASKWPASGELSAQWVQALFAGTA